MSEQLFTNREASSASSFSPKTSPRGSRSPMAAPFNVRHDSTTGTLKMTISAGKNPAVVNSGPFYLMKEPTGETDLTGSTNLMAHYGLEHSYNKFTGKKVKDSLSSFLPSLPGVLDTPAHLTHSSLKALIEKPPVFKDFVPLTTFQLNGFRLQHGPLPEQYRFQSKPSPSSKRHKHKRSGGHGSDSATPSHDPSASNDFSLGSGMNASNASVGVGQSSDGHEKKPHKKKKNDDEKEKKKKKKEKKKKKQRHSPEHISSSSLDNKMIL